MPTATATNIAAEIDALQHMSTKDLIHRYEDLHGEPSRSRHRVYLIRRIAWRIQALAEGDLSERARRRAEELAQDADVRVTAPRTMIVPGQATGGHTVARALRCDQRTWASPWLKEKPHDRSKFKSMQVAFCCRPCNYKHLQQMER